MSKKNIDRSLNDDSLQSDVNGRDELSVNSADKVKPSKASRSAKATATKGAKSKPSAEDKITFEEKLARLEDIVDKIEGSNKPLEELIALFKEGITLSKECKKELNKLEVEVQKVLSENSDGTLRTENMEVK